MEALLFNAQSETQKISPSPPLSSEGRTSDKRAGGRARRSDLSGRSSPASTLQRRRSFDRWPIWGVKKERRDREREIQEIAPMEQASERAELGSVRVGIERRQWRRGTTAVSTASLLLLARSLARLAGEPDALSCEVALPIARHISKRVYLLDIRSNI